MAEASRSQLNRVLASVYASGQPKQATEPAAQPGDMQAADAAAALGMAATAPGGEAGNVLNPDIYIVRHHL